MLYETSRENREHRENRENRVSRPAREVAARFERVAETLPAGRRAVTMVDIADRSVGRLDYQICHPCRLGYIGNIAVATHWQGQGLGRQALHTALAGCADYSWSTSRQSSEGRRFFAAIEDETETAFPPSGVRCPHMAP
ncbi:GNAT family N-acetyltransferase [Streptomyces sp. NBC_01381]|uniref:GNAT family N-acetyltransferase n=1 Tax=Streptomyces sp. NBC_01381 TaxID=2903845 RepID=UPI002251FA70|nr:GNAT family N-acetyltransferase [Streptomyces sp. NBC_01381]MCX4672226.1 GNAT family N-acetyltransferase [Streptomyces sp. NBC_01381]